ncbi:MAG: Gfo/Idh/MocA family oxidoreductase [Chthoniobacterales bacterium]
MRAAIIGCGPSGPQRGGVHSISYAHARAMSTVGKRIQLVAAASRSEKNLEDFTTEFAGLRGYQDYRSLLAEECPEFVSICAFPPDREAMVLAALEVGARAIWVEKPFAISMGSAHRMIQAAEAAGARLFVNFQRRYGRPFEWVREALASGRIGSVTSVQVSQPGNEVINFGPHLIDAALNLLNVPFDRQPVRVLGAVEWSDDSYQGVPVETQIVGTVHFSDGCRMILEAGKYFAARLPIIRIDGEYGFVELRLSPLANEEGMARARFKDDSSVTVLNSDDNFHHGATEPNLYVDRALIDILQALESDQPCRLDAATVLPGLEVLLALFESAQQSKMLTLPLKQQESPFQRRFIRC